MRMILKYEFSPVEGDKSTQMPQGSWIIHVANQRENLCIWAVVETNNKMVLRKMSAVITGVTLISSSVSSTHIGTALFDDGNHVIHVFDHGEA